MHLIDESKPRKCQDVEIGETKSVLRRLKFEKG